METEKDIWNKVGKFLSFGSEARNTARNKKLSSIRSNRKVYFITSGKLVKVGFSEYPESRIDAIKTSRPDAKLIGYISGGTELEKKIHKELKNWSAGREWFYFVPEVEEIIKKYMENK